MTSHDADRVLWSSEQARHLMDRAGPKIDRENVARAIERLGEADVDQLRQRITILLTALIRWGYDPDIRSMGPYATIGRQRDQIARLLEDSPGLVPIAERLVIETYPEARRAAAMENGPFDDAFPAGLPFLPSEVFDDGFLPDPYGDDTADGPDGWRRR